MTAPQDCFEQLPTDSAREAVLFLVILGTLIGCAAAAPKLAELLRVLERAAQTDRRGALAIAAIVGATELLPGVCVFLALWVGVVAVRAVVLSFLAGRVGGQTGVRRAFCVLAFASAPQVFGMTPTLEWAGWVYAMYLTVRGVERVQSLSLGGAVFVVAMLEAALRVPDFIGSAWNWMRAAA
jgi:hypothetical protein